MMTPRKFLPALLLLSCVFGSSAWADYEKGLEAYKRRDYATAYQEFLPEAEQGQAEAQSILGTMHLYGWGVPKDPPKAVAWFQKAAAQGFAPAQYFLGNQYRIGREGVPQDRTEAINLYRRAAEQNYAPAQHELGLIYERGEIVPQDSNEAVKWYRKAAELGDAASAAYLGNLYYYGTGIPKSSKDALTWYYKSAAGGFWQGFLGLVTMYSSEPSIQDMPLALAFRILADRADPTTLGKARDFAKKLTSDEIIQGRALADSWRPGVVLTNGRSLEELLALLDNADKK